MLLYEVLIEVLQRVLARGAGAADDVAAVGDLVGEHEREIVDAVAHHVAGVDVVALVVADEELAVAVRAGDAQHGGIAAQLAEGRQRGGHLAAALPAGLEYARALVLVGGQVVDVDEIINKRGSVGDQFSFHGTFHPS